MSESFGRLLQGYLDRAGVSRNAFAHRVGVDPSYATRVCHDERGAPRFHIVEAMARELRLTEEERDHFYLMAGYAPGSIRGSGWSPALHLTACILNDYRLSAEDRAQFEVTICAIAEHWVTSRPAS